MQLDAVHGHRHLADVDFLVFASKQVVITRQIGRGVADVAEESAQRAVVVEAQRQRANRAIGGLQLDGHVHRNAQRGVDRALHGVGFDNRAAALVGKQIDRVRRVVPQQMVGPAAGLAERVHVGAAEKVGLHIHLLDVEFARFDLVVHILVAGVEAAGVAAHGDQAAAFRQRHHVVRAFERVCQWDFDLHVFAGFQASQRLLGVHLGGGAQNHGIDFFERQALVQVSGDVANAVLGGGFSGFFQVTADQGDDFHAVNVFDAVQMFDAESTCASEGDFDGFSHVHFLN